MFVHNYGQVHTRQTANFIQFDVRTTNKRMCITIGGPMLWNSNETSLWEEISMQMLGT